MLSVEEALARITGAFTPLAPETVALDAALGRVLAEDARARVTQPPRDVSAMDGYAVRAADVRVAPARLKVVGQAPAGAAYEADLGPGEAVRIFTGAPVPAGADAVVMQEDTQADGETVTVKLGVPAGHHIRRAGLDFQAGALGLEAGRRLSARDVGLLAAMNHPWVRVRRHPRIAILATGDEIVLPGEALGHSQIIGSNGPALAALVRACGADPIHLGVAPDNREALGAMAESARGTDLLVTTGGVSVGDHDLVRQVLDDRGFDLDFWKIAMRPGKPLLFGRIGDTPVLGLPGNPVSTLVCALLFLRPAIDAMLGRVGTDDGPHNAVLGADLAANDRRQAYLRARLATDPAGQRVATPFDRQDSAMLTNLAHADCLIVRPPNAAPAQTGDTVPIVPFSGGACEI